MSTISDTITNNANYTEQLKSKTDTETGAASANLSSTDFLDLLMKQLQFQDPMAPTDNAQFVSQQCQFAQLSATQEMNSNMSSSNSIMQTLSMVGKDVTMVNPDDPTKTITGTVEEANFYTDGSTITVNGKEYPISLIKSVQNHTATSST